MITLMNVDLFGRLFLSGTWGYPTLGHLVLGGCYVRARPIMYKPCPHFLRAGCRPTADFVYPGLTHYVLKRSSHEVQHLCVSTPVNPFHKILRGAS